MTPGISTMKIPLIDCSREDALLRCAHCSAYLSPFCSVDDEDFIWKCSVCHKPTPIPSAFSTVDSFLERQELTSPVYDVVTPRTYARSSGTPLYLFIFDLSYKALELDFTQQMVRTIRSSLNVLPTTARVGIMTMSDRLSVFDLINRREVVISDLSDHDLPFQFASLFPRLRDCKLNFVEALDSLLARECNDPLQSHCLGSALSLAGQLLRGRGGAVFAGYLGLPRHGPYALRPRSASHRGTLRLPVDGSGRFYRECGISFCRGSLTVHIFTAGPDSAELPALSVPPGLTAGTCNYYDDFSEANRTRLHNDLFARMSATCCWDASLRLRSSSNVRLTRSHANCLCKSDQTLLVPVLPRDATIAFEIALTAPIEDDHVVLQLAFIHSDSRARRIIRVFTMVYPVSPDLGMVLASIDEGALAVMLARRAATALLATGTTAAKHAIAKDVQAVFVGGVRYVALYHLIHGLLCNPAIQHHSPIGVDARMAQLVQVRAMGIVQLLIFMYPRMIAIIPGRPILPMTRRSLELADVMIFHTWRTIFVWVKRTVSTEILRDAFGVVSFIELQNDLPTLEGDLNKELHRIIQQCWDLTGIYISVEVIGEGNEGEAAISQFFVDDSTACGCDLTRWMARFGVLP
jgi:hypothetical protein